MYKITLLVFLLSACAHYPETNFNKEIESIRLISNTRLNECQIIIQNLKLKGEISKNPDGRIIPAPEMAINHLKAKALNAQANSVFVNEMTEDPFSFSEKVNLSGDVYRCKSDKKLNY